MPPHPEAVAPGWGSFQLEPTLLVLALAPATLYLVGWLRLRRRMPQRFGAGRLTAFLAGVATVLVALISPIDPLADELLSAHMAQHLLLMMVAPPLIWLGWPVAPVLRGFPRRLRFHVVRLLGRAPVRRLGRLLGRPQVAWVGFMVLFWSWHAPPCYELAIRNDRVHDLEHLSFLAAGLLFWWPVIRPWPFRPRWPAWVIVPYLVLAALENTAFSALFTFSSHVIYPSYAVTPRLWGIAPLADQALAGVIMWIPGSIAMLLPLVLQVRTLLEPTLHPPRLPVGHSASH